jgi:hypothetical protein
LNKISREEKLDDSTAGWMKDCLDKADEVEFEARKEDKRVLGIITNYFRGLELNSEENPGPRQMRHQFF